MTRMTALCALLSLGCVVGALPGCSGDEDSSSGDESAGAGGTVAGGGGSLTGGTGGATSGGGTSTGGTGAAAGAGGTPTGGAAGSTAAGGAEGGSGGSAGTGGDGGSSPTGGAGGEPATGGSGGVPPGFELAPTHQVSFTENNDEFNNPERGFYQYVDITGETSLDWVYSGGYSLAYSYVRLDDYRDAPIAQSLLDDMQRGLDAARDAGVKVILRFAYNFGPYPNSEPDASKSQILEHIGQVAPYLQSNVDVIAAVQAGFIGAWGEWHTSTNDLLADPQDRRDILEALLDAVPSSRTVHLRYPPYKEEMYGAALTASQAFDGSYAARTGHHNDCFLSSDTDVGTYPSSEVEQWKVYLEQDTQYVPMGGETCALHDRGLCPTAEAEMARLHFSYLNRDYHPDVIDRWISDGCYDRIKRELGYRLVLRQAQVPDSVRPGGAFVLEVDLENVGYAAPFNPRPVQVVLDGPGGTYRAEATGVDPRWWLPGQTVSLRLSVQLPTNLATGTYDLALALPDAAASIADRPEYAIRFANDNVWIAAGGYNQLATVQVDAGAPGDSAPDANDLVVVPQG